MKLQWRYSSDESGWIDMSGNNDGNERGLVGAHLRSEKGASGQSDRVSFVVDVPVESRSNSPSSAFAVENLAPTTIT